MVIMIRVGYFSCHRYSNILVYHICIGHKPSFKNILHNIKVHFMMGGFKHSAEEIKIIELKAWMIK